MNNTTNSLMNPESSSNISLKETFAQKALGRLSALSSVCLCVCWCVTEVCEVL